jgi:hypothetical protein
MNRSVTDLSTWPKRQTAPHEIPESSRADLSAKNGERRLVIATILGGILLATGSAVGNLAVWINWVALLAPGQINPANADQPGDPPKLGKMPPLPVLKPSTLDKGRLAISFKESLGDVAVGGGGRFLILHMVKSRQLAVFDVNEAKVVHEFPAPAENIAFAAGIDKLVIVLGRHVDRIERWDLNTKKREWTAPAPPGVRVVKAACMGSASRGPVLVQWADDDKDEVALAPVEFLDLENLQPLLLQAKNPKGQGRLGFVLRDYMNFRASAEGSVFGGWCTSHTPEGAHSYVLDGNKIHIHYQHESYGHVIPGTDGKTFYTHGKQLTNELVKAHEGSDFTVPAVRGPYYLRAGIQLNQDTATISGFTAYRTGDNRPVLTDADIMLTMHRVEVKHGRLPLDKRVHFVPDARLLITIPITNDQLVLNRFDVIEAAQKKAEGK